MNKQKSKVFISHSWEDNEISKKLAEYLKRDEAEIWIDYARISGGESLPDRISEALEWCDTLVLLWSDSAASAYYVGLEWKSALDLKKKIIPCIIDNTKLPAILRSFLYIDFKDIESGYLSLARALKLVVKEKEQEVIPKKAATKTKVKQISAKPKTLTLLSHFRCSSTQLSENDVTTMLKKYDFFDKYKNKTGHGFDNQYEDHTIEDDKIVIDRTSGLMWQQSGSSKEMNFEDVEQWIIELNQKGFAGFNDWRLPTLEEAMSLMEPEQSYDDLYIDPVFDDKQIWIWTSDQVKGGLWAWVVYFHSGDCYSTSFANYGSVRAVRSGQSSQEQTIFRSNPQVLSEADIKSMLKKYGFFDTYYNKNSKGFNHQYKTKTIKFERIVIDKASGLMWQQSGSSKEMKFEDVEQWIKELNQKRFAGFTDWRLPTLEEAMSLMEPEEKNERYINPIFDIKQMWIWTMDHVKGKSKAWIVNFVYGNCDWSSFDYFNYVRAVRSR